MIYVLLYCFGSLGLLYFLTVSFDLAYELMVGISLFSLSCWVTFYINDAPKLLTPSGLHMPTLNDLPEGCSRNEEQEYVENYIVPAHEYFKMRKIAEKYDEYFNGLCSYCSYFLILISLHFFGNSVLDLDTSVFWKVVLCSALPALTGTALYLIYRKCSFCSRNKWRIDINFEKSRYPKNCSMVLRHYAYLEGEYKPMRNRYYISLIANTIAFVAFFLIFEN